MKRKLLLGLLSLATSLVSAQVQIIDDPAFEDELIRRGHDSNPTRDGQILISDAEAVTFLNLTGDDNFNENQNDIGLGITNLNGIKAFSNLEILWVQGNDLIELDLEGISSLKDVRAFFNDLERINVNGLSNLEIIGLNVNKLKGINVSTNTSLQTFDIDQNNLLSLDLSGLIELTSANFQDNSQLSCILVEDSTTANSYNGDVAFRRNGTTVFSENCPNIYTQIPDRNFEISLIAQGYDSEGGIPNGLVLTQDLEAITSLDLSGTNFSGENISSLEGLDAFTALTDLNISYNPLNLPNNDLVLTNTQLETIIARNCNLDGASFPTILNEVVTLDFSNEDPRRRTIPSVNSFSTINGLGGVPNMITFRIAWNNLTLLEVAGAQKIEKLFLGKNFELAEIRSLNTLVNLNQMEADDNSLGLGNPAGTIDVSGNSKLEILNLDRSKITAIDLSNNPELRLLSISDVNLSPTIDLSANTNLTFLDLVNSQLSSLSIASNTELDRIELDRNNLTTLDVSQNNKLIEIQLADNNLSALNISNTDTNLSSFDTTGNNNLNCIQVSDLGNVRNSWEKDAQTSYSVNCNSTEKTVEVSVISGQQLDANNFYTVVSANDPMQIGFNLLDENGDELDAGVLANYGLNVTTVAATNQNPAQGGNVNTPGIDFELLTNEVIQVNTVNNGSDGNRTITMNADQLFEADEYFFIQTSTNDPNITLKNAVNGIVEIPVKIVDNEVTNVDLELLDNGIEGSQNVKVRINSSLANNTGADMPFTIALQNGSATEGADFELNDTTIQLPNGQSFVDIDITVLPDQDATEGMEDFSATVSYVGGIDPNRINITNGTVTATITDDTATGQPFIVSTAIGGDVVEVSGTACCPEYEIEEGQLLEFNFDADSNATIGEEYIVQVSFANGTATEADVSVRENSPNFQYTYSVKSSSPDNTLQIDIKDDMIDETNGETLKVTLTPVGSNYSFSGTTVYDVRIKDKSEPTSESLVITTTLEGAGMDPYYELDEGGTFNLNIDSNNGSSAGENYQLEISYETYTIAESEGDEFDFDFIPNRRELQEKGDVVLQNESNTNTYAFIVDPSGIDGLLTFSVDDDTINENTEELVISVRALQNNISVKTNTFIIKIKANDPVEVIVTLEDAGSNNDYSVQEGESFKLIANIVGSTNLSFPVNIDYDLSTATGSSSNRFIVNSDFSVDLFQNLNESSFGNDYNSTFQVYLDGISGEQENIVIRLPKPDGNYYWSNANANGEVQFTVPIVDRQLTASAEIKNAILGTDGVYEIEEGNAFYLEINALNLTPGLSLGELPLVVTTNQSSASQGGDFDISNYPEKLQDYTNTIDFATIVDGISDDNETIQISLPRPLGGYTWQNANNDGSLTFTIRIIDKPLVEATNNYTLELFANLNTQDEFGDFGSSSRKLITENDIYKIKDNETLELKLSPENSNNLPIGVQITSIDGSAIFEKDFLSYSDLNKSKIIYGSSLGSLYFATISPNNPNKTFNLELEPTTENYNLLSPVGDIVTMLQKLNLAFEIESSGTRPTQIITTNLTGAALNRRNQDAIVREYLAKETDTVQIFLNALKPNSNQGAKYNIGFTIDNKSTFTPDDYTLKIEDADGNDMGDLSNYTVDNTKDYDAKIIIILKDDGASETQETLSFSLIPDVTFDNNNGGIIEQRTGFEAAEGSDILEYRILVSEPGAPEIVYTRLTNTGGVEGSTIPDVLTMTLIDKDGNPYNGHAGQIVIPFDVIEYEVEGLNLTDNEYSISGTAFTFSPGQNTATIEVLYKNELNEDNEPDENDIDCDYYYIRLKQPTANSSATIVLNKQDYLVKVADKSEFLVFVDLDLKNVKPVIRNRHPNDTYDVGGFFDGECSQCINSYLVEEGTDLRFTVDAARPVPRGNEYRLNLDIKGTTSKSFAFNKDISLPDFGDQLKGLQVFVDENEIDEEIIVKIEKDQDEEEEGEEFTIGFKEPYNEKRYRFSKRDSRSYENSYRIKIIDAIPASAKESDDYNTIVEEDSENKYGIISISLTKPAKEAFFISFELLGKAELGVNKDYIIESKNNLVFDGSKGAIYFNSGDQVVELKIIPTDDDFDEREEDIRLKLIDDFGYSLGASQSAVLTIVDNDKSDLTATISPQQITIDEDRNEKYSETIEITLDKNNTTGEDIKVNLLLNGDNPLAELNEDFQLYEIFEDGSQRSIAIAEDFYVTIPNLLQSSKILIETVEDGPSNEGNEKVIVELSAGSGYFPIEPKSTTITIIDNPEDGIDPPINSDQITAKVISSSCEGINRGKIVVSNPTDYNYVAILFYNGENIDEKKLHARQTDTGKPLFKKLAAGKYEIYLDYDLEQGQTSPQNLPPSFFLEVDTAPNIKLLESKVLDSKMGSIIVSGSYKYFLKSNGNTYEYESENTKSLKLIFPLESGLNQISIKGETDCQNILKTSLLLNNLIAYPNPTPNQVYLSGFEAMSEVKLVLVDTSGKIVLDNTLKITSEVLTIDLSTMAPGNYFGNVTLEDGTMLSIKLIKK